jgi:Na+(H+)/acetate symporter ActP
MITKLIIFVVGLAVIAFLFQVNNAMSKPVYNKMHNMWQDDPEGRKYAQITIIIMLIIAFILGSVMV